MSDSLDNISTENLEQKLDSIGAGLPRVKAEVAPSEPDLAQLVQLALDSRVADLENKWILVALRRYYGASILVFCWVYFLVSMAIILAAGFKISGFSLAPQVLTALVGGTAVSVLGVVGTVAAGLFKTKEK